MNMQSLMVRESPEVNEIPAPLEVEFISRNKHEEKVAVLLEIIGRSS